MPPRAPKGPPVSPEVLESRRAIITIERELIFGMMKSYQFYRNMRDTICPWDPEMRTHRMDFSVDKYNVLYRAIDAFYRRFDQQTIVSPNLYLPNSVLAATIVDWANRNNIPTSTAEQLLAEIIEETEFTKSLTHESLTALSQGAAFQDWLKSRVVEQTFGKFQSQRGVGALTLESMIVEMKKCEKAVRSLDVGIVTPSQVQEVNLEPGPFPIDALNPVMRAIAEQTAEVHRIAASVTALATMATLSGAIGKSVQVLGAVNGHATSANIYVTIAAHKSYGKGAAAQVVKPLLDASEIISQKFLSEKRPLLRAELMGIQGRVEVIQKSLKQSGTSRENQAENPGANIEDLAKLLKQQEELELALKTTPTLWVGSATGAALAENLAANGETIFSFSPEAGDMVRIALGRFNKGSSGDFDLLLSGYSGEWAAESRVSRGTNRMQPSITTLWFCQPFVLSEILNNEEAAERGLTARILGLVIGEETIPEDDGIERSVSPEASKAWEKLVAGVLEQRTKSQTPHKIKCSPEAREVFRFFHNESVGLRNGQFRDVSGELGRWRENAIRVAAGLWVADTQTDLCSLDSMLSAEQAERAVRLVRWVQTSTLAYTGVERAKKRLEEVHNLISRLESLGLEITLRDVERRAGVDRAKILALASDFPELIRIVRKTPPTGRPSEVLQILK